MSNDAIIVPPAPAPSFTNPSEYARRPSNFESANFGFMDNTGISEIDLTVSKKFALLSSIMYEVVPIATRSCHIQLILPRQVLQPSEYLLPE